MYLNSSFFGQIPKKHENLIAKIRFFDIVCVWLYLTVSKLDFNNTCTMHFGLSVSYRSGKKNDVIVSADSSC
jgi:hypothetical protein